MLTLNPAFAETEIPESPALLARAQQGDSDSFCQLCRIHGNGLVRQATALCSDASLAEDLAQETLFEAWKCIRRYNGQCRFFTWLCAIMLNRFRNTETDRSKTADLDAIAVMLAGFTGRTGE